MSLNVIDLRNLAQLIFMRRRVRLWPYEMPLKILPNGKRIVNNSISLPPGTPDMIGRSIITGQWYGVENKTENDTIKKHQKEQLDLIINDNGHAFILKAINENICHLINWKNKEIEIIKVEDYK